MNVAKDGFKDRHLENWETVEENQNKIPKTAKEPPYTERYIRWCGRSVDKIVICLLPDVI